MMRLLICLFFLAVTFALPARAAGPDGLWLTENNRSVIEVGACDGAPDRLCGRIHWIIAGGMQFDAKNPDEAQRHTPMCGLRILSGFKQQDETHWANGMIYKADDGDTYHATLQMLPDGKLLVHGYVGMPLFGKSQTWVRADAKEYPGCRPAR